MSSRGLVYYRERFAGYITETDLGYEFVYDENYLKLQEPKPVSLTLPLRSEKYISKTLFSFFDGLIPEGWLLDIAREHWKVSTNDRFQLLLLTCADTIGAVTVLPESNEPEKVKYV